MSTHFAAWRGGTTPLLPPPKKNYATGIKTKDFWLPTAEYIKSLFTYKDTALFSEVSQTLHF